MYGSTPVTDGTRVIFLDEYRIMVLISRSTIDVPEFALFDTSVPRGHPVSSKRFRAPPSYRGWYPTLFVDSDRISGTLDQDRPLADPTQAVFVIKLISPQHTLRVLLIVRTQTLIEHMRSASADTCVPWDVWGRGTVVMKVPPRDGPYPLVHGTRMIVVRKSATPGIEGYHHHLHTFDFSRRGWSVLPLCDDGDGVGRRAAFEDGRNLLLQGDQKMVEWRFQSLGDGRFIYLVSRPRRQTV